VPKSKVQPQNVAKLCGHTKKFNGILICPKTGGAKKASTFFQALIIIHGIGN